jgi:hypothetical protein
VAGAVALLVAFLAGLGTGALVFDEPVSEPSIPTAALFDDLGLTAEQTAHVDSVLAATRSSTGEVLEETRLELTTIANEALQAIDRVLTPEQIETVRARIEARARRPVPDSAADRPEPSG